MKNKEQILLRMKEIQLRGLSKNTLESYITNARIFLDYCNRPAEQLNEHDIRKFLGYLINEKKAMHGTVTEGEDWNEAFEHACETIVGFLEEAVADQWHVELDVVQVMNSD